MTQSEREEKIQEIRRDMAAVETVTVTVWKADVDLLLEEIERLQHERDEWKAEAYKAAHNEVEVSQLREALQQAKSIGFEHVEVLREERAVLIETIRWYAVRSGADLKMNETFRALGIGEEHENPSKP